MRTNVPHHNRYILTVGESNDNDNTTILEKLFYYILLPACANTHLCGMGVNFDNVAITLAYNGPVFADNVNTDDMILRYLENGTLRSLLMASEISPTISMIRLLATSFLTCPYITQAARVQSNRDACQSISTHDAGRNIGHSILVNGVAMFAISEKYRDIAERLFYPVPFHKMYCDPMVAATLHPVVAGYITRLPQQRDNTVFNVPPQLMAEYEEWHKSPMVAYFRNCKPHPLSLSTGLAMHTKLSPISFICQAKHKMHPGFAMTIVRTDEVLAENLMYSSRASTSVFVGQPSVCRKEVRADAVNFEINNELASLDTGLGYSSIITPARVAAITTDMGIHCQDFFSVFPSELFPYREINDFIKKKLGMEIGGEMGRLRNPRNYLGGGTTCASTLPGLSHGQLSTCEVILTPVTADVTYFQSSNSPRGRASCVVSCDTYSPETAEKFLYDHSLPDPVYEYRTTINPWASQIGSLGDVLYNANFRQVAAPGLYSPCRQFFNKEEILKNNRGLYTLVTEYANRLSGQQATSNTDIQYVVINGTDVFLEQPCMFLQEAFPTISASHKGLLDEFMSYKNTHAPVHHNQYFIEEVAPVKRIFKVGNKIAF